MSYNSPSGAHHLCNQISAPSHSNMVSPYSNAWHSHKTSVPLCMLESRPGPRSFWVPGDTIQCRWSKYSNWWSMECSNMALENKHPILCHSTPAWTLSGLTHEQSASSTSPFSTAWQRIILVADLQFNSRAQWQHRRGIQLSVQDCPTHSPHSCARYFPVVQEAAPAGGSSLEKQGNSKKLHWQKSFDEHSVLNLSKSSFLKFHELSNERNTFS